MTNYHLVSNKKSIFLLFFFLGIISISVSQTKISVGSGSWGTASNWSPSGVPTITNNVIISNGNTIDIDVNAACASLTVGTGTSGRLRYSGNTNRTLTVANDVLVRSGGRFYTRNSSNATHTLNISGNISNSGSIDFFRNTNRVVNIVFSKNGNQTFTGAGTLIDLNLLVLNMGASSNNLVDFLATNFTIQNDFLKLANGTFRFSSAGAFNLTPFSGTTTIPTNAGVWMNSSASTLTTSDDVTLQGRVVVTNGILNIGNTTDEDLLSSGGTLSVTTGSLNIAGKYHTSGAASNFNISGGTLTVPTFTSTSTTIAPFNITTAGSVFNMTGGSIVIRREGGSGAQDLGFVNTGSSSGAVTGGTLVLGNSTTPASQTININSTYSIGSLRINNANITAKLNTNSLLVTNHVIISSGVLVPGNLNITLGGSWNNSSTFTPGSGTVTFNSNTAQSVLKTGGETFNHLTFSGSGIKTFSCPITTNGNFSITAGSNADVSSSNFSLTVKGNFTNSGTFNTRSGLVFLNGTTPQTVGGSAVTNFFNLSLTNPSGATLTNAENLIGTLTLNSGTLASAGFLTMVSTATATARIASIAVGADISGNVIVQRFAPGGTTGWALFGTPISSALTLNDWDDDIFISCSTCPDGSASGFLSIYTYDETKSGVYDDVLSYIPLGTINDPIVAGQGYWVYLGDGQFTTNNITIDVTGTVRKFNYSIPLKFTNTGSTPDDGWNLITNPYPSAISWTLLAAGTANLDNAIYVYNADLNGGAGGQASYVNGVSSPAVGSGGIGDIIPMSQGFQVHSTGATALNATESIKVAGNPTYLKTNAASSNALLRLNLKNNGGYNDETVLYFQTGASNGFDVQYDSYKMRGQDPSAPSMALKNGDEFQINGVAPIVGTFTMSLITLTGYPGTYTISANNISSFPNGACINLYDKFTATSTNLKTSDYVFNLSDTTTVARFELSITINTLQVNSNINQPVCKTPNGGEIIATGNNSGPWNYYWKNSNGGVIKTTLNKPVADTLNNLSGGLFNLEMNTVGMCDNSYTSYNINAVSIPVVSFFCPDTVDMSMNGSVTFNNLSFNAISYLWDFGDSTAFSAMPTPTHIYNTVGVYTVTLLATSIDGCTNTFTKTVVITDQFTGINTLAKSANGILLKTLGENNFLLCVSFEKTTAVNFKLYDVYGKLVADYGTIESSAINLPIALKNFQAGVYFINIAHAGEKTIVKLVVR